MFLRKSLNPLRGGVSLLAEIFTSPSPELSVECSSSVGCRNLYCRTFGPIMKKTRHSFLVAAIRLWNDGQACACIVRSNNDRKIAEIRYGSFRMLHSSVNNKEVTSKGDFGFKGNGGHRNQGCRKEVCAPRICKRVSAYGLQLYNYGCPRRIDFR